MQRHILVIELFVDTPVIFHHERIIWRGNKQHIKNAPLHKILESRVFQIKLAQRFLIHIPILSISTNACRHNTQFPPCTYSTVCQTRLFKRMIASAGSGSANT